MKKLIAMITTMTLSVNLFGIDRLKKGQRAPVCNNVPGKGVKYFVIDRRK